MHTESENGHPMFTFTRYVDLLLKGQGHKYIKRIPYMTPKGRRYRYIYDVTHTHRGTKAIDESHLVVGTAFMLNNEADQVKHGHITHIDGDRVTFIIDDGPKKAKKSQQPRQKSSDTSIKHTASRLESPRNVLRSTHRSHRLGKQALRNKLQDSRNA